MIMPKTLKDIDSYADSQEIPLDLLQEWAREWVKHAEEQVKLFEEDENYDREQINFWLGYRMAIIDFFDLEDEDE